MLGTLESGLWSDSVSHLSDREVYIVQMPESYDINELTHMDLDRCSGITPAIAAYYGGVPSLMYAVLQPDTATPQGKFKNVIKGTSSDDEEFNAFVNALLCGTPGQLTLAKYLPFASGVSNNQLVKWPPCYIHCIMDYFSNFPIARASKKCLADLEHITETVGGGMVWEASTRVAILLQAALAVDKYGKADGPLGVCDHEDAKGADVRMVALGVGVKAPAQAHRVMHAYAQRTMKPSLVLFVPSEAQFVQFDGFVCLIRNREIVSTAAFQCKDRSEGATGIVPEWITCGGHLLRAEAPMSCKTLGQHSNGWYYYNQEDTDEFLGWSLRIMRRPEKLAGA